MKSSPPQPIRVVKVARLKSNSWKPRVDKSGPLLWNTVTLQSIQEIPTSYGTPYDWVCLRDGSHYRYHVNVATLERSGAALYTRLLHQRQATRASLVRSTVLSKNLRTVYQTLVRTDARSLSRHQLSLLFERVLAAHLAANSYVYVGGIVDTWAARLEAMLRKELPAAQVAETVASLLADPPHNVARSGFGQPVRTMATLIRNVGQAMLELREQLEQNRTCFTPVLEEIRRRMKVTASDGDSISLRQITEYLQNGILPTRASILANKGTIVLAVIDGRTIELHGAQARQWHAALIAEESALQEATLQGTPACPGKTRGKVRVVRDANDLHRFQAGEVLVAFLTMPAYVPIMTKAAAIITEVGGMTSHAAVVSRELGTPCIVGVRAVMNRLKTGDLVEVDADNGVVRRLTGASDEQ